MVYLRKALTFAPALIIAASAAGEQEQLWQSSDLAVGALMGMYNVLQDEAYGSTCFSSLNSFAMEAIELSQYFDSGIESVPKFVIDMLK